METMTRRCELWSDTHEEGGSPAVARAHMEWTTRAGERRQDDRDLCQECLDDKRREFKRGDVDLGDAREGVFRIIERY